MQNTFNRTTMELKQNIGLVEKTIVVAFNRTTMELKQASYFAPNKSKASSFNRTTMELKLVKKP